MSFASRASIHASTTLTFAAHHLGQTVDVNRVHVERLLDLLAHGKRPGLGAEDADLEGRLQLVGKLRC